MNQTRRRATLCNTITWCLTTTLPTAGTMAASGVNGVTVSQAQEHLMVMEYPTCVDEFDYHGEVNSQTHAKSFTWDHDSMRWEFNHLGSVTYSQFDSQGGEYPWPAEQKYPCISSLPNSDIHDTSMDKTITAVSGVEADPGDCIVFETIEGGASGNHIDEIVDEVCKIYEPRLQCNVTPRYGTVIDFGTGTSSELENKPYMMEFDAHCEDGKTRDLNLKLSYPTTDNPVIWRSGKYKDCPYDAGDAPTTITVPSYHWFAVCLHLDLQNVTPGNHTWTEVLVIEYI